MTTCFLQGGLGNYMFQIAATHALALELGTDSLFNESDNINHQAVHRSHLLYKDNILRKIKFTNSKIKTPTVFRERGFEYQELPKIDNILLYGYFQSEKYFINKKNEIKELFDPREEDILYIKKKYGDLSNTCSIHVRRGDYISKSNYHPVCSTQYYEQAMNNFPPKTRFLIFSDDITWCKKNFIGDSFIFIENEVDFIDMYLMSMCINNIIANSTFSWWGAWLNKNKNKKIISPINWFGPAKPLNIRDVIPHNWVKI